MRFARVAGVILIMKRVRPKLPLNMSGAVLVAVCSVAMAGCHHAPLPMRATEGASSFAFIDAPAVADPQGKPEIATGPRQPVDVVVAAEPILPLAAPVYPRAALGAQRTSAFVGVRITVDASGRVTNIDPSLRAISTPGVFAEEFRAAVESALAQWRFTPAENRHLVPGKGGPMKEDYWVVTRAEKTDAVFDIVFTFTPSGDVVSGPVK